MSMQRMLARLACERSQSFSQGASPGAKVENSAAYEALRALLERAEAATLLDPVDRLLYQETLKSSVKSHVEGVKVLLAPFFLYNPLYGFLLQPSQTRADQGACGLGGDEAAGFEIQAAMAAPLRPVLPRFPLLPVAMASTLAYTSSTDLDARLGLSAEAMDRAAARAAAASGGVGAPGSGLGWMRDASSLVGSGLGSLGIGKALGGNWTTGLGFQGGSAKPPEAV
ncbi:unnamed protein product [Prorocentrum cordatum]|uniref:Uncharacterized protein n=1 Tax=Prorocentrum cordatum TaxID=2364126 RepID=A0ABN9VT83_9DINO|nr:unnamed protein product [Polarella glacialis]